MATEPLRIPVSTPGANRAVGSLQRMAGAAKLIGVAFAALKIGQVFARAIAVSRAFEFEMSQVQAITGATAEEFVALNARARELGATTIFSATQAASGLIQLARAGFTAQESISAIGAALGLAQAGTIALSRSSEILTGVIAAYGLEAERAGDVSDILVQVSNSSKTSVETLGRAFTFVGSAAAVSGVSLQQVSAALGAISQGGVPTQRAGRGLATTLAILTRETDKVDSALRRVGLRARDVNPEFNDFNDVVKNLTLAFPNLSSASAAFDAVSARAVVTLTQQSEVYAKLEEAAGNAGGATENFQNVVADTLEGDVRSLNSAFEEYLLVLGDKGGLVSAYRLVIRTSTLFLAALTKTDTQLVTTNKSARTSIRTLAVFQAIFFSLGATIATVVRALNVIRINLAAIGKFLGATAAGGITAGVKASREEIEKLPEAVGEVITSFKDATSPVDAYTKALEGLEAAIRKADEAAGRKSKTIETLGRRVKETAGETGDYAERQQELQTAVSTTTSTLSQLSDIVGTILNQFNSINRNEQTTNSLRDNLDFNVRRIEDLRNEVRKETNQQRIDSLESRIDDLIRENFRIRGDLIDQRFGAVQRNINFGTNLFNSSVGFAGGLSNSIGSGAFKGLQSFHDGGYVGGRRGGTAGREVPVLAQTGEGIFTPNQLDNADRLISALNQRGNANFTIIDQRSADAPAPQIRRSPQGNVSVIIRDQIRGVIGTGQVDDIIQSRFGVRRRGV